MVTCCDHFPPRRCTVSSNDPADFAQPSSSMSLVSSRYSPSLSLLSRLVFQEGLLLLPPLPVFTGWLRSWMLNSMHWWSLKVISSFERKIPGPIQYNQVIPSDHLADQEPPPVHAGSSPLGRLTIKIARNQGPPTSLSQ